jgi:serine/threonine protein kinase
VRLHDLAANGETDPGPRDLLALAIVLYELLAGDVPFHGDTPVDIAVAHLQDDPPPLPARTPANIAVAINRALAKDPDARFASVETFAAALRDKATAPFAGPRPTAVTSRAPKAPRRPVEATTTVDAARGQGRNRRRVILSVGVLAVIAAIAAGAAMLSGSGDPARAPATTSTDHSQASTSSPSAEEPASPAAVRATVPRVKGLSEAAAQRRLRARHLEFAVVRAASRSVARDRVVRQRPAVGTRVDQGATVRLTVSTGPPPVKVPDVAGALLHANATQIASSRPAGTVISQTPSAGATLPPGSTVALSVARPKAWSRVASDTLDSDGSTQSFRVRGRQWRIVYTLTAVSCEFATIECDAPSLEIHKVSGYGAYDSVELSPGTHATAGTPDGPGRFRLTVSSYVGQWKVALTVEQLS